MLTNSRKTHSSRLAAGISAGGIVLGVAIGFLVGAKPLYLSLALAAAVVFVLFFVRFQQAVLGLLILRSSLDLFSEQQVPAAFAIGLDVLTICYVAVQLLTGERVRIDKFFWLFAAWVSIQGLWVVLLPLHGLGLDGSYVPTALREWIRLFSWLMVYLLVMQLRDRCPPKQVVSLLFFGLVAPLSVAALQTFLPPSLLPSLLTSVAADAPGETVSRINGTLGHPNTFATFLLLFIGLTYWKVQQSSQRLPWIILLGLLAFFFVGTKALFSIVMLGVFIFVLLAPRLNIFSLLAGILIFAVIIGLFASTEFGRDRLGSIASTPLLNPDIDLSRAILLSKGDYNSFNWRLSQWTYLLQQWRYSPLLGYGLGTSAYVSTNALYPHNDYIRALVEGGVVGLGTFLAFLGLQFSRLVQLWRSSTSPEQRRFCWVLIALFTAIPIGMITENIWSHTTFFFHWWALLAIAGWDWSEFRQDNASETAAAEDKQNRFSTQAVP